MPILAKGSPQQARLNPKANPLGRRRADHGTTSSILEGLSKTVARDLPHSDGASDLREREGAIHTINQGTGNRVVSQFVDSVTGKRVKDADEARAYERGEEDYIILTDDDLQVVELETVRTIDIETFVSRDKIE